MALENNQTGSQAPSQGQDFKAKVLDAQKSGDFGKLINEGKEAVKTFDRMLATVWAGNWTGQHADGVSVLLNMLRNMKLQAEEQVEVFRRTENEVKQAFKAAQKQKTVGPDAPGSDKPETAKTEIPLSVVGHTDEPPSEPPTPPVQEPVGPVMVDARPGWEERPHA